MTLIQNILTALKGGAQRIILSGVDPISYKAYSCEIKHRLSCHGHITDENGSKRMIGSSFRLLIVIMWKNMFQQKNNSCLNVFQPPEQDTFRMFVSMESLLSGNHFRDYRGIVGACICRTCPVEGYSIDQSLSESAMNRIQSSLRYLLLFVITSKTLRVLSMKT